MIQFTSSVRATLKPAPAKLVYGDLSLEVYQNGRGIVAVEHRHDEDRYSLYIGKDIEDLRDRTAYDIVRRGLIDRTEEIRIEEVMT